MSQNLVANVLFTEFKRQIDGTIKLQSPTLKFHLHKSIIMAQSESKQNNKYWANMKFSKFKRESIKLIKLQLQD